VGGAVSTGTAVVTATATDVVAAAVVELAVVAAGALGGTESEVEVSAPHAAMVDATTRTHRPRIV